MLSNIEFGVKIEIKESKTTWKIREYIDDTKSNTIVTFVFSEIEKYSENKLELKEMVYKLNATELNLVEATDTTLILVKELNL